MNQKDKIAVMALRRFVAAEEKRALDEVKLPGNFIEETLNWMKEGIPPRKDHNTRIADSSDLKWLAGDGPWGLFATTHWAKGSTREDRSDDFRAIYQRCRQPVLVWLKQHCCARENEDLLMEFFDQLFQSNFQNKGGVREHR